jgi:monoamine oxidase
LHQHGFDMMLLEARGRLGGRILSRPAADPAGPAFDLGPTWFWPGQHRMETLVRTLGLEGDIFDQPSSGEALYEDDRGSVHRGLSGVSMAGSLRLDGGIAKVIDRLAQRIPETIVRLRTQATQITRNADCLRTTVRHQGHDVVIDSARVVIALPPRLAASSIVFSPALAATHRDALLQTPTWMAGHAKLIALYDQPFWRTNGLSGDAISYRGPLSEIHDASPSAGGPAALFGFVGVPPSARDGREQTVKEAACSQLERLFGPQAAQPREIWIKDWAFDRLTATENDRETQHVHAPPWSIEMTKAGWDGRLLWSGSETAHEGPRNNGYLEGALEASQRTLRQLASS